jgi:hypothetical protein
MTIRVCAYAAQHANSKVPMFVQRVDPLSPFFERFFIFRRGWKDSAEKKLQKTDLDTMKKITHAWDVAIRSAPKHQTMSTSFLLCTSAGTLTGLSEDKVSQLQ